MRLVLIALIAGCTSSSPPDPSSSVTLELDVIPASIHVGSSAMATLYVNTNQSPTEPPMPSAPPGLMADPPNLVTITQQGDTDEVLGIAAGQVTLMTTYLDQQVTAPLDVLP
jgi:hypothetical protein